MSKLVFEEDLRGRINDMVYAFTDDLEAEISLLDSMLEMALRLMTIEQKVAFVTDLKTTLANSDSPEHDFILEEHREEVQEDLDLLLAMDLSD